MKYLNLPSYERLHELFEYNQKTGELYRKKDYRKRKEVEKIYNYTNRHGKERNRYSEKYIKISER